MQLSNPTWLVFVACFLLLPETSLGGVILVESLQTQGRSAPKLIANSAVSARINQDEGYNDDLVLRCKRTRQMTHVLGGKTVTHSTNLVRCKPLLGLY